MTTTDLHTPAHDRLLVAMLRLLRRRGIGAAAVTRYEECSYNIGYCPTCSERVTEVRIWYTRVIDDAVDHWDFLGDLGELIRDLAHDDDEQTVMASVAVRETEDQRWSRLGKAHSVDEALTIGAEVRVKDDWPTDCEHCLIPIAPWRPEAWPLVRTMTHIKTDGGPDWDTNRDHEPAVAGAVSDVTE